MSSSSTPQQPKRRILVVDDEEQILLIVCQMLERLGYEAQGVVSGAEALELIESAGSFDGVLADLNMPEMDGWELVRRIRATDVSVPVAAFTGLPRDEILPLLPGSGIDLAIFKPVDLASLIKVVEFMFETI